MTFRGSTTNVTQSVKTKKSNKIKLLFTLITFTWWLKRQKNWLKVHLTTVSLPLFFRRRGWSLFFFAGFLRGNSPFRPYEQFQRDILNERTQYIERTEKNYLGRNHRNQMNRPYRWNFFSFLPSFLLSSTREGLSPCEVYFHLRSSCPYSNDLQLNHSQCGSLRLGRRPVFTIHE